MKYNKEIKRVESRTRAHSIRGKMHSWVTKRNLYTKRNLKMSYYQIIAEMCKHSNSLAIYLRQLKNDT